jgi:hypothetical protein
MFKKFLAASLAALILATSNFLAADTSGVGFMEPILASR